jgi:galactokinase
MDKRVIQQIFSDQFSGEAQLLVTSPGRINLIGEHTDYNNGFVLPAAIDQCIQFAIGKRFDNEIRLYSIDKKEWYTSSTGDLQRSPLLWPDYIIGVADELQKAGKLIHGFNAVVTGNIPLGAGLSSSAALECATIFALNELFNLQLDRISMVKLSQKAENNFVGVQCGIMDQFASMMGKAGHVIKLDCQSLAYEYFPLQLEGYSIVLLDSQVKHSLASSEYNTRRNECNAGIQSINKKYPGVKSLRDASIAMVDEMITHKVVHNRCRFILEENERLQQGCEDLQKGDIAAFGKKMYITHEGLSKLYEVSCAELDFLVNECRKEKDILGARMMGGGFGGCVIAIIKNESVELITRRIGEVYREQIEKNLKVYITSISDGTALS